MGMCEKTIFLCYLRCLSLPPKMPNVPLDVKIILVCIDSLFSWIIWIIWDQHISVLSPSSHGSTSTYSLVTLGSTAPSKSLVPQFIPYQPLLQSILLIIRDRPSFLFTICQSFKLTKRSVKIVASVLLGPFITSSVWSVQDFL